MFSCNIIVNCYDIVYLKHIAILYGNSVILLTPCFQLLTSCFLFQVDEVAQTIYVLYYLFVTLWLF